MMKSNTRENKKGAVIILVSKLRHTNTYDAKLIRRVAEQYHTVLIAEKRCQGEIDPVLVASFDQVEYVEAANETELFYFHDVKKIRSIIEAVIFDYPAEHCHVCNEDEGNVENVALAIDGLGISGPSVDKAHLFRDKDKMKSHVKRHGISVPEHILDFSQYSYSFLKKKLGSPFVIKPLDGGGAYGFNLISNQKDYSNFINCVDNVSLYHAETFIDGALFHVESVVVDGKTIASCVSEYLHPLGETLEGYPTASVLLTENDPNLVKLNDFNHKVLAAFSVDGNFHAEYFVNSSGDVVFLEIAWRQCGQPGMTNFMQLYGCSQACYLLKKKCGIDFDGGYAKSYGYYFVVYISKQEGRYQGFKLPIMPAHYDVVSEINTDEVCNEMSIYLEKAVEIKVHASSLEELYRLFVALRRAGKLGLYSPLVETQVA